MSVRMEDEGEGREEEEEGEERGWGRGERQGGGGEGGGRGSRVNRQRERQVRSSRPVCSSVCLSLLLLKINKCTSLKLTNGDSNALSGQLLECIISDKLLENEKIMHMQCK